MASSKIVRKNYQAAHPGKAGRKAVPTDLENQVAQALFDLENNSADLKAELKDLHFISAKDIDVPSGVVKKAVVIFVPYPELKQYHRIQVRLIRELEKKFGGRHVVIVAMRKIIPKASRSSLKAVEVRPNSRTATSVHKAMLDDLVYPTEIVGKRTRYRVDGSSLLKVILDRKDQQNIEHKLKTFSTIYKKIAGKQVEFEFPVVQHE